MRRTIFTVAATALLVLAAVGPTTAAAQKVALVPCADEYDGTCAINSEPVGGGGFAVFNNSAGPGDNLELTVSLKKAMPGTAHDIYYYVDSINAGTMAGTVTTNTVGNATFHTNTVVPLGEHMLAVDVVYQGSGNDV